MKKLNLTVSILLASVAASSTFGSAPYVTEKAGDRINLFVGEYEKDYRSYYMKSDEKKAVQDLKKKCDAVGGVLVGSISTNWEYTVESYGNIDWQKWNAYGVCKF